MSIARPLLGVTNGGETVFFPADPEFPFGPGGPWSPFGPDLPCGPSRPIGPGGPESKLYYFSQYQSSKSK